MAPPIGEKENTRVLEIETLLDILGQVDRSSPFFSQASKFLSNHLVRGGWPCEPDPPDIDVDGVPPTLTIGMATFDDFDGVYFSVQAIRMFHPEIAPITEIVVIDNNPHGSHAKPLQAFLNTLDGCRYVAARYPQGTGARDLVFREARGEWVVCMDCHVFFEPGSLKKLVDFLTQQTHSRDLFQGPLLADPMDSLSTHFDPKWNAGMWGFWGRDERGAQADAAPFEIPMNGLAVFACRRAAWPGINPRLRGFGGEEGCLHEKFHQNGGVTWCLPFFRWIHRFARPNGLPYPNRWADRIYNYLTWFDELELDPAPIIEHFTKYLGEEAAKSLVRAAQREIVNPFHFFDAIYCISPNGPSNRWEEVTKRFTKLGIEKRIRRTPGFETPHDPRIGRALGHRAMIANASKQGLQNVLIFEDDVIFSLNALEELANGVEELRKRKWWTCHLGGCPIEARVRKAPGCCYLQIAERQTGTHAVAFHAAAYGRILSDVPDTPSGMAQWLRCRRDLGDYYADAFEGKQLQIRPAIATLPKWIHQEARMFDEAVMDLEAAAATTEKVLSASVAQCQRSEFKASVIANWRQEQTQLAVKAT